MDTLPKLLQRNFTSRPSKVAVREKYLGIWEEHTWQSVYEEVGQLACRLLSDGCKAGDDVAIIGNNRYSLFCSMTACQLIQAVPLPIYANLCGNELEHMINLTDARFAIVHDQQQVDALLGLEGLHKPLERIFYVDERGLKQYKMNMLSSVEALKESGRQYQSTHQGVVESMIKKTSEDATAFITFTSGVNVYPKAVSISHRIAIHVGRTTVKTESITSDDEVLSFMPISSESSLLFGYVVPYISGMCVSYPESMDTILDNLCEINPTVLCVPPEVYQYLAGAIRGRIEFGKGIAKKLYKYYMGSAVDEGRPVSIFGQLLIAHPICDLYGIGRIRTALVGEGSIDDLTYRFFLALGIGVRKMYGNVETFGHISKQFMSVGVEDVGHVAEGMEVKVAENGEILCRGKNVVDGYLNDPAATKIFFKDGWHHTGDIGEIRADGLLTVHDRVDAVVSTNKVTYMPRVVEEEIKASSYVKDAFVAGTKEGGLAAVIVLNKEVMNQWADHEGINYTGLADMTTKEEVQKLITSIVAQSNQRLKSKMQPPVSGFVLFHRLFTPNAGEITWMNKLRRPFLLGFFKDVIASIDNQESNAKLYDPVNKDDIEFTVMHVNTTHTPKN